MSAMPKPRRRRGRMSSSFSSIVGSGTLVRYTGGCWVRSTPGTSAGGSLSSLTLSGGRAAAASTGDVGDAGWAMLKDGSSVSDSDSGVSPLACAAAQVSRLSVKSAVLCDIRSFFVLSPGKRTAFPLGFRSGT